MNVTHAEWGWKGKLMPYRDDEGKVAVVWTSMHGAGWYDMTDLIVEVVI